ncbi:hypothetical protein WJX79_008343 [Trebouxia sp. C0005]
MYGTAPSTAILPTQEHGGLRSCAGRQITLGLRIARPWASLFLVAALCSSLGVVRIGSSQRNRQAVPSAEILEF